MNSWQPKTLTGLLNFYLGIGLIGIIFLLGAAGYYLISHILENSLERKAQALGKQVATISLDAVMLQEYTVIERMASDLIENDRDLVALRIENARNQVLTEVNNGSHSAEKTLQVQHPLSFFNHSVGMITLTFTKDSIEKTLSQLFLLLVVGLIVILVSLLYAVKKLLLRHLVNPIKQLSEDLNSTQKIFYETLEFKSDLPAELGVLNHAIRELQKALRHHIKSLEQAHQFATQATQNLCQSQRLATVGQMAAGLAHNLNTPLANIIGYTQMALLQTEDSGLQQRLHTIERQAKSCADSVKSLLTAAKPPILEPTKLELVEFCQNIIDLMRPVTKRKSNIELQLSAPQKAFAIVDQSALEQILFNLISNSMEAEAKNIWLSITPSNSEETYWKIHVCDDGHGIPKEKQQQIFEPFFTTKLIQEQDSNGGSGLGLYLTRNMMQQMNGSVELVKSDHLGSEFILKVPKL
ncbi:HAMP domain-containing histidine kinase [Thiomicrorhabdus sp. 6S2-11]|uniref:histidine kinase n=1 Tax=Thiomicrorhabdus marina TaxID=2818442 RepID=A0ABS3Q524_9GAMM|nr:HAMP domain-containing sensor histidine kinase [Thiomicrorhabdus marina]MBO1927258.1 HAMP domain-containing histidine kinase [Thiomicrorhabdus marina]